MDNSRLEMNVRLNRDESRTSPSGEYHLVFQVDSNLVLYKGSPDTPQHAIWATNTEWLPNTQKPTHAIVQTDANFALSVDDVFVPAKWQSGTWGQGYINPWLWVQDDGNVVVYHNGLTPVWAVGRWPDKVGALPGRGNVNAGLGGINIPSTVNNIGNGHFIVSDVGMTHERAVTGHTFLTCTNKVFGFTAGVRLIYRDVNGRNLGTWPHPGDDGAGQWGINQAPLIGANHRSVDWFDGAPEGTAKIELLQFWAPRDRFPSILNAVAQVAGEVEQGVEFIATFCKKYPELCALVSTVAAAVA